MRLFRLFFLLVILFVTFALGVFFFFAERENIDVSVLQKYSTGKPSVVYDEEEHELFRFQLDKRDPITYDKLPENLIKAFIAAEDWNFFNHSGIAIKSIIRSFLVNLYHMRVVQGASTITQQLAKLLFLSYKRTITRKLQEIFLAFQLERQLTKEQILELYLNNVYFGRGIYGVEAACQRFWSKSVVSITLDQAAILAAIAKSAKIYSPLNSPVMAAKRRNIVLSSMLKLNFIKEQEYKMAIKEKVEIQEYLNGHGHIRLYLQEWVRNWVESKWGKDVLYKNGLKIKLSINKQQQELAESIFLSHIKNIREKFKQDLNGGMIAIDSFTGKIKAFIGGYDYKESQFNRCFQASRQIGSTFKPIIYSCAVQSGINFDEVMVDEPVQILLENGQTYEPRNWDHEFHGPMTLVRALTLSTNIIAIKLFMKVGPRNVIDLAKNFGIDNPTLNTYPSAALGTAQASVEQVAAAFNVFANSGNYVKPYLIEWVKDNKDKKIWEKDIVKWPVLDIKTTCKMTNALSYRIKKAFILLGCPNNWINAQAIGKTGTTNDATSLWFVGSTPELTTCVYIGRDDNKSMGQDVYATSTTFPIWLEFNRNIKFNKKYFYVDPSLHEVAINWETGEPIYDSGQIDIVKILK